MTKPSGRCKCATGNASDWIMSIFLVRSMKLMQQRTHHCAIKMSRNRFAHMGTFNIYFYFATMVLSLSLRGWLHERFGVAISCPICCKSQMRFGACDLVSHTELLPFTHSMRYGVAICCVIWCRSRNRTPNRICDLVQKKTEMPYQS
jgi:hypothetical protein